MQSLTNSLLNMFFVSLPEELFVVAMVLICIGKDDLLDIRMWKENLKWVILPAIGMSFIVSFAKFINIPKPYNQIVGMIVLYGLLIVVVINNNIIKDEIKYIKIFAYTLLAFVIIAILESGYYPLICSLTKTTIIYINSNFIYNFLSALPARAIEYSILVYLLVKRKDDIKIKLFNIILRNNFLKKSMIGLLVSIAFIIIYLIKLIGIDLVLENLPFAEQLFDTILIFIIPTIAITWMLLIVNHTLKSERRSQQTYENLATQDNVMDDVDNKHKEGGEFK